MWRLVNYFLSCFAENYFRGQDIPLNERFSNEQYYSIQDEFKEKAEYEDEVEMGNLRPLMNRYAYQLLFEQFHQPQCSFEILTICLWCRHWNSVTFIVGYKECHHQELWIQYVWSFSATSVLNRTPMHVWLKSVFFCLLQRQQLIPDPGDLRYDLERRRQQKMEGVKITIAGANFASIPPERYGLKIVFFLKG